MAGVVRRVMQRRDVREPNTPDQHAAKQGGPDRGNEHVGTGSRLNPGKRARWGHFVSHVYLLLRTALSTRRHALYPMRTDLQVQRSARHKFFRSCGVWVTTGIGW